MAAEDNYLLSDPSRKSFADLQITSIITKVEGAPRPAVTWEKDQKEGGRERR